MIETIDGPRFPCGKLRDDDEGELETRIGIVDDTVVIMCREKARAAADGPPAPSE